jgi:hypothetical protein
MKYRRSPQLFFHVNMGEEKTFNRNCHSCFPGALIKLKSGCREKLQNTVNAIDLAMGRSITLTFTAPFKAVQKSEYFKHIQAKIVFFHRFGPRTPQDFTPSSGPLDCNFGGNPDRNSCNFPPSSGLLDW